MHSTFPNLYGQIVQSSRCMNPTDRTLNVTLYYTLKLAYLSNCLSPYERWTGLLAATATIAMQVPKRMALTYIYLCIVGPANIAPFPISHLPKEVENKKNLFLWLLIIQLEVQRIMSSTDISHVWLLPLVLCFFYLFHVRKLHILFPSRSEVLTKAGPWYHSISKILPPTCQISRTVACKSE